MRPHYEGLDPHLLAERELTQRSGSSKREGSYLPELLIFVFLLSLLVRARHVVVRVVGDGIAKPYEPEGARGYLEEAASSRAERTERTASSGEP